jgi:hypothetical protein
MSERAEAEASADEPAGCVRCGCTDERGCLTPEGRWHWIEAGVLCSGCIPTIASILADADRCEAAALDRKRAHDLDTGEDVDLAKMVLNLGSDGFRMFTAAAQLRALAAIAARLGPTSVVVQESDLDLDGMAPGLFVAGDPRRAR